MKYRIRSFLLGATVAALISGYAHAWAKPAAPLPIACDSIEHLIGLILVGDNYDPELMVPERKPSNGM